MREERLQQVRIQYESTDNTIAEIAETVELPYSVVFQHIHAVYPKSWRDERKKKCYSNSKLGDKNPMKGKFREEHHNYIGEIGDGYGYMQIIKPSWYTGRKGSKHVFVHHLVICESLGITEIPKGWCVHHIDEDKMNNSLSNLALMTVSAHSYLHYQEKLGK